MSQYKRKYQERRNGTKLLPRSAWRKMEDIVLRTKVRNKPKLYRLEVRVINPEFARKERWFVRLYGNGEWKRTRRSYQTPQSARDALLSAQKKDSCCFGIKLKYRIKTC